MPLKITMTQVKLRGKGPERCSGCRSRIDWGHLKREGEARPRGAWMVVRCHQCDHKFLY